MVVRLTSFSVSPEKAQETKNLYAEEVVPEVKKQKGNSNVMLLEPVDASNEYISITAWDSKEDADAYHNSGKYKELVSKIQGLIGQPILKSYNTN
jgi:heme-degrading monooxygenase HmoA